MVCIVRYIACVVSLGVFVASPSFASAQWAPSRTITGDLPFDKLGEAIASVPDVTGDGRPEIIVGVFRGDQPGNPTTIVDCGAAKLYDGAKLRLLWTLYGEKANGRMGYAVSGVPDLDGDGKGDVLIGAPRHDGIDTWSGRVYVVSGATGQIIRRLEGAVGTAQLGFSVAGLGDIDGDGAGDIVAGAYGQNGTLGRDAGHAFVYSGKTGAILADLEGEGLDHYFGVAVARLPDADGDGKDDFIVGASDWDQAPAAGRRGRAYVYSGATRQLIRTHDGENPNDVFGWAVAGVPDANGDGRGDVLVGARDYDPPGLRDAGRGYLFSGADGTRLFTFDATKSGDNLGRNVAGVPDVDGDGRGDVLLPAHRGDGKAGIDSGIVYLLSGATGNVLYTFEGESAGDYLGWGVGGIDDINGDGLGDLLIGAYPTSVPNKQEAGRAFVYTTGLAASPRMISAALGGTITLTLDIGAGNANRPYLVLGSLAGIEPGIPLPKVHLPLSIDPVVQAMFLAPNSFFFRNTRGNLDANGRATSSILILNNWLTGAVGRNLTFAFGLIDDLKMASNPVQIEITP